jgi:hypothetical protein
MKIIGPEVLIFGADDVAACDQFLTDYGLKSVGGGRYEALDGTGLVILPQDDTSLPPALSTGNALRKQVYGVADAATLEAIAVELGKDREVRRRADGSIESRDDYGFCLGFQLSRRRSLDLPGERVNAPGDSGGRAINQAGVDVNARPLPRTLSHYALFAPMNVRGEDFYIKRLGFRITDRLLGAGPFLQPGGTSEHHTLFLINTPPHMQGMEHVAFHLGGPNDVMLAGHALAAKGYSTFWGPGRHTMGSNWFWYFNSPLGCRLEYDADMDRLDGHWTPREMQASAESTQVFLLQAREKWAPVGGPPPGGAH